MSMKTTKVGDVVRLDSIVWSYRGNHTKGHIGVVTAIHDMADPIGGHPWVNVDGEKGAPFWMPTTGMTTLADVGRLLEDMFEDMEHGDTLIAVGRNTGVNHLKVGASYTALANVCECCFHFEDDDGDLMYHWDDNFYFINLSALKREYQTDTSPVEVAVAGASADLIFLDEGVERIAPLNHKYDEMDDAAKGAILLAAHEGKTVQFMSPSGGFWVDDTSFDPDENFAYRVKPQELTDAEEALNAAADNVVSLEEARDNAREALDKAVDAFKDARSLSDTAEFELASAKDVVEALRAA